ncbi:hypothetical protein BTVI_40387 [Pitangus sulphuratus]|nr:hypothetical protein BTVI_40387 [Pitangus sulphuratus]
MSSGGSLSTMQRLVEQLKLEAAVERIKGAIPSENPDPVLYSENREGHQRIAFKHDMNNNCLSFTRKVSLCVLTFMWLKAVS